MVLKYKKEEEEEEEKDERGAFLSKNVENGRKLDGVTS